MGGTPKYYVYNGLYILNIECLLLDINLVIVLWITEWSVNSLLLCDFWITKDK